MNEAINWVNSRLPLGIRPGLERVEKLAELVGNPQRDLKIIHVAGTNGKGSTVAFMRNLLEARGFKVGTFTSPFIELFNERISINGEPISDEDLTELVLKYRPLIEDLDLQDEYKNLTEFEIITIMAFDYFKSENVDYAIIEVGLGGLLDSTNILTPVLSVITTIGLDHTDILGETIEEIAFQKAGIIKSGVPVVVGNVGTKALNVISKVAQKKNSKLILADKPVENFALGLDGAHQKENAAVAIAAVKELGFEVEPKALEITKWPGRFERIAPNLILDGAHNEHAMTRLVENLNTNYADIDKKIIFAAINTKDTTRMIEMLKTVKNAKIILTTFDYVKAVSDYASDLPYVENWRAIALDAELNLFTGSLYFISEIRRGILDDHN